MPGFRHLVAVFAFASALGLSVAAAVPAVALEARLPRHPAPSPDGSTIAFSWQGDLWLVAAEGGAARRITVHPGADRFPSWSPDGAWIAFSSNRHGHEDVYALPVDGSEAPRRLTHASSDDRPMGFEADGESVLFTTRRAEGIRRGAALYRAKMEGGTPEMLLPALGLSFSRSPDGERLAFTRGGTYWGRRGYRGAANRDLWLWSGGDDYRQLTDFDGDDDFPSWTDGETLALRSSRAGRKNVFLLPVGGGEPRQLTFHDGTDVRHPRASVGGAYVAYEFEDALWTVPTGGGDPRRLAIDVPADSLVNAVERRAEGQGATELAVSPDGALAAFVLHGDVFLTEITSEDDQKIAPPPTRRLTETDVRESDLSWAPDGKALVFSSQRSGSGDLYLLKPAGDAGWLDAADFTTARLTDDPAREHGVRFSPDGEKIAYLRGEATLFVAKADGSEPRALLDHWSSPDYQWSPDGKWIAYSIPDYGYNEEVWLVAASGGTPYNVSRHPDDDTAPRFSADGKRLLWLSQRHGDTADVWGVWLTREDHERTPEGWLKHWKEQGSGKNAEPEPSEPGVEDEKKAKKGKKGKGKKGKKGKKTSKDESEDEDAKAEGEDAEEKRELPEVKIDFDRLWERAEGVTALLGDEDSVLTTSDSKAVLFTAEPDGERDLYSVRWDGEEQKRLTEGGIEPRALQVVDEAIFFLDGDGRVKRIATDGMPGDPVPFTARYAVDRRAEAEAAFEEAWLALDDFFYDGDFHGADWRAVRETYRPWALAASHAEDFEDVVNLMLGELNASHMAYRGPREDRGEETGWIGATFDPAAGGPGILVSEVLPDSPAARVDVGLKAGERILEVNGEEIGPADNAYAFFADTVGVATRLTVRSAAGEAGQPKDRQVSVEPIAYFPLRQLRYEQWTREREALVEKLSGGRLGYLHIQGMNIPSFEEFERDLYAAGHGKEGLIIDVRSNGGGWTTDYLMAVLEVERHAWTMPRGGDPSVRAYPQGRLPLAAWTRPALTLCDEESYSNAEIFSHAFKSLGRGTLVGNTTFGAVISTGGTGLLNGGFVRLPTRGWYVAGSGTNMELHGAVPDVLVPRPPQQDTSADADAQLERAVEVFLAGIEEDPRYGAW